MKLFYLVWVDCLVRMKLQPANSDSWRLISFASMTIAMAANLILIATIVHTHFIGETVYDFNLPLLPKSVESVVKFMILYVSPPAVFNFFVIFYRHRYNHLMKKYPYHDGRLFLTYFLFSMLLPGALALIAAFWR